MRYATALSGGFGWGCASGLPITYASKISSRFMSITSAGSAASRAAAMLASSASMTVELPVRWSVESLTELIAGFLRGGDQAAVMLTVCEPRLQRWRLTGVPPGQADAQSAFGTQRRYGVAAEPVSLVQQVASPEADAPTLWPTLADAGRQQAGAVDGLL